MSIFSLLYANTLVVSIFSTAIASAYAICKIYDAPFYNAQTIVNDLEKIRDNVIPLYFGSIYMALSTHYFIEYREHSLAEFVGNVITYSFLIEGLYYLYYNVQSKAKQYVSIPTIVYPLDALQLNMFHLSCYLACLHLPTFWMSLNVLEYICVLYFYTTMGLLMHSQIAKEYSIMLHKYNKPDSCLVFPVCDYFVYHLNKSRLSQHRKMDEFFDLDKEEEDEDDEISSTADKEGDFVKIEKTSGSTSEGELTDDISE